MATSEPEQIEQSTQDLPTLPTVEEMTEWDEKVLLRWIQQRNLNLKEKDLADFIEADLPGSSFLASSAERFRNICGFSPRLSLALDGLVNEVKKGKFIPWMQLRHQLTVS